MEDGHETELLAYYSRGEEHDRLAAGGGQLEFLRTTEIIQRRLPPAPARVADIGGGPGRYALWLAALGYQVEHRDLMPLHVRQLETERFPHVRSAAETVERTGVLSPLHPGSFCGFCHRPQQLRGELRTAGLTVAELVNVEGPAFLLGDLAERLDDPVARAVVLDTVRAVERVPELLGIGPHLLATGIGP